MKYDLSVLIPARNEQFLALTVESLLKNIRGKTEIIIVLDGEWADPGIPDDERVTVVYHPESVGQRAATNDAAKLSKAKYVMKLDAHCTVDEGFDVKMIEAMQDNYTMVPAMYNLHAFNWKCKKCGNTWYQGPTPRYCCKDREGKLKNNRCNSQEFERVMVWKPRENRKSYFFRFDKTLHFQYWGAFKDRPEAQGDIAETMSLQGSCFMLTRDKYWELKICDEEFGSWGQQGVEVAVKTWLSGGRVVVNKKTWYSHMFRTQGGDFGFPYPLSGRQVDHARKYSRELLQGDKWEKAIHPFSWLLEKFYPIPDWHEGGSIVKDFKRKGIIYYTDNQLNLKIAHAVKKQIKKMGLPIVSSSLKPMDFGKNVHIKRERGYKTYFLQILAALEASDAEIIFFCEHDWLYHPSHFDFLPERKDTFYYNSNWWRVRASDGHAVHYDTQLVPTIVGYRETLIDYYRQAIKHLEELTITLGSESKAALRVGFEPGTHKRVPFTGNYKVEWFSSEYPNIDIRHDNNLTASKWSPDAFRSPKNAQGWKETDIIPGWGKIKGRFSELLSNI